AKHGDRSPPLDARVAMEFAVENRCEHIRSTIEREPARTEVGKSDAGDCRGLAKGFESVETLARTPAEATRLGTGQIRAPELFERIVPRELLVPPRVGGVPQLSIE